MRNHLEGCTAPQRDENQLHAAVVELIALDNAEIKIFYRSKLVPGDKEGKGGVFNFVTKRGLCETNSKFHGRRWKQVLQLPGNTFLRAPKAIIQSVNFIPLPQLNNYQQADTGTKMIHLGKNTRSTIISKGISAGKSQNSYRGFLGKQKREDNARNFFTMYSY